MRKFLLSLLTCLSLDRVALADAGDDTLEFYLSRSDLVVLGEFASEPLGEVREAGVVNYGADFQIARLIKGEALGERRDGGTIKVCVIRFEMVPEDRLPELKKGGKCILFLKYQERPGPTYVTSDVWFGVQRPGPWMARSLARLVRQQNKTRTPPGKEARDGEQTAKGPITAEMRQALGRFNKVHAGMPKKDIDDAVEALHREIARLDPKVFVPLALHDLMRMAPRDTQTRILLRRALAKGWLEEQLARAWLVQAGDDPGPHIKALMKDLDSADPRIQARAASALAATGAAGAAALPKLREIKARAKADPEDYRRAYTLRDRMPVHVVAHYAILRIESELRDRKPPTPSPASR